MPQSLSNVMLHLVFSTKNRSRSLRDEWRDPLHRYVSGIMEQHKCQSIITNSVDDHIHMLFGLSRTITIADLVKELKTGTAKWIHRQDSRSSDFAWQRGYGVFSISPSHKDQVIGYIRNQAEHHKVVTFQDELRRLLEIYRVKYDEAYVWD